MPGTPPTSGFLLVRKPVIVDDAGARLPAWRVPAMFHVAMPTMRSASRKLVQLACGLVFMVAGCQTPPPPTEGVRVSSVGLTAAIHGANRVDVGLRGESPLLVRRGADVATEFISQVPIDESAGEFRCECGRPVSVRFYTGDRLLADLEVYNQRSMRWQNGPWTSDARLANTAAHSFEGWYGSVGGNPGQLSFGPSGVNGDWVNERDQASARFAECFPSSARQVVELVGMSIRNDLAPWREPSTLRELMPNGVALASAAFHAFAVGPEPWLQDDYRTAAVQTAVEALPANDFTAALEACANDQAALRGAARIYLRFSLHQKFDAAFNAQWLPRLADAELQGGRPMDKPVALIYLAQSNEPAAWRFLHEIATGKRTYPWTTACPLPGDAHMTMAHEPSLAAAAALLCALNGERVSVHKSQDTVSGLDDAAAEIANAALDHTHPLQQSDFRYASHILGYAGAEVLARRPPRTVSAIELGAALAHTDTWVRQRLSAIAQLAQIEPYYETAHSSLFLAPVQQELASENPAEAIRQCSALLPTSYGPTRTSLLVIRAASYETQNNWPLAIADFEAALRAGHYSVANIHRKLAWLKLGQGQLADMKRHAEEVLRAGPDPDMYMLRGTAAYASDDFSGATEMNFLMAMGLAPGNGYALVYQHLTSMLGGRPELSRLRTDNKPKDPPPAQFKITIMPGPSLGLDFGGAPVVDPWAAAIISFLKSEISAEELLGRTPPHAAGQPSTQRAEAFFYISQKARLEGHGDPERDYLDQCLATPIPQLAEYQLAVSRRQRLKPETGPRE